MELAKQNYTEHIKLLNSLNLVENHACTLANYQIRVRHHHDTITEGIG